MVDMGEGGGGYGLGKVERFDGVIENNKGMSKRMRL